MNKIVWIFGLLIVIGLQVVSGQATNTVCCEKTNTGKFCQDVPVGECAEGARSVPTSCESTSFCKPGVCYSSTEGTCLDNTPQITCNAENNGIWSEESPPQCELGCCKLGDQAAFVTLVRCKKLSASLGLETNYDNSIGSELACVQSVSNQDKGACVYDFEFERTCKFTTRTECNSGINNGSIQGTFFEDKLCSAEELGTNCGPSEKTVCLPGKDEVYFIDTCGNQANIYDSSKLKDQDYWTNTKDKTESCNPNNGNGNSRSCGNCNYLLGSFCRAEETVGANAVVGDFICADLNCKDSEGEERLHGESWCVGDAQTTQNGVNKVGSRFFKQICLNGEIITEACSDFRNEECIQDSIEFSGNEFSQAACRVNRWQDCLSQTDKSTCENVDRRDCFWSEDVTIGLNGSADGSCLPLNPPGLEFWESEEALALCSQANTQCIVKFEKGLFGGEGCKENCDCLTEDWEKQRADVCSALGDCGPKLNWINQQGYKKGYELIKS